jgi:ribonuclease HI
MIATLEHDKLVRVLVTLWAIWHARRKAVLEQIYQSPLSVHHFVEGFVADLMQIEDKKSTKRILRSPQALPSLAPPPLGMLKVNVDALVSKTTGRGSVAAVIRDEQGIFVGTSTLVFPGKTEAETLEALACREAVAIARDVNARRVQVASDCLSVIKSLEQGTMGAYANIVREIKDSVQDFEVLSFAHERRSMNKEADRLAKSCVFFLPGAKSCVLDESGRQVWLVTGKDVAEHYLSYTPLLQYMHRFRKSLSVNAALTWL